MIRGQFLHSAERLREWEKRKGRGVQGVGATLSFVRSGCSPAGPDGTWILSVFLLDIKGLRQAGPAAEKSQRPGVFHPNAHPLF